MIKKFNEKEIVCYNCGKNKGIAKLKSKMIEKTEDIKNKAGKLSRVGTGEFKKIFYWEAQGFITLSDHYLCNKCLKNKCKRCKILLSNTNKCSSCGKYHGAFYNEHPSYCKQCWDVIEASKKI